MQRRNRLGSSRLIRRVYAEGVRIPTHGLICTALVEGAGDPKLTVVASRRVGGAVERNRAKRRIRAAASPLVDRMRPGSLVVIAAGAGATDMNFQNLEESLLAAMKRSGVLADA